MCSKPQEIRLQIQSRVIPDKQLKSLTAFILQSHGTQSSGTSIGYMHVTEKFAKSTNKTCLEKKEG